MSPVIDPGKMKEVRQIKNANGPGMVLFCLRSLRLRTVELHARIRCDRYNQLSGGRASAASQPFLAKPGSQQRREEVWFTLKDTGKVQVVSGEPPFRILATLEDRPLHQSRNTGGQRQGQIRLCHLRRSERSQGLSQGNAARVDHEDSHRRSAARHPPLGDNKRVYVGWKTAMQCWRSTRSATTSLPLSRSARPRRLWFTFRAQWQRAMALPTLRRSA